MMYKILIIILLLVFICLQKSKENFYDFKSENCEIEKPLVSLNCNIVPNFPRDIEPDVANVVYSTEPFERLTPEEGKYTFCIPELKYDGIYSKNDENCSWDLYYNNKEDTYSSDVFLKKEKDYRRIMSKEHCK